MACLGLSAPRPKAHAPEYALLPSALPVRLRRSESDDVLELTVDLVKALLSQRVGLELISEPALHPMLQSCLDHPSVRLRRAVLDAFHTLAGLPPAGVAALFDCGNVETTFALLQVRSRVPWGGRTARRARAERKGGYFGPGALPEGVGGSAVVLRVAAPVQHGGDAQGCIRREGTSEEVGQAVGGGCQSGWGRLLSVRNAIEAGTWRQADRQAGRTCPTTTPVWTVFYFEGLIVRWAPGVGGGGGCPAIIVCVIGGEAAHWPEVVPATAMMYWIWCMASYETIRHAIASVRRVTRDQMELGPTGSDTGRSWFLLSCGCDRSRYY